MKCGYYCSWAVQPAVAARGDGVAWIGRDIHATRLCRANFVDGANYALLIRRREQREITDARIRRIEFFFHSLRERFDSCLQ